MAAADDRQLADRISSVNISEDAEIKCSAKWGFPLEELYKIALQFYKEKEGKAIHLSYKDKLKLVAYTKQVSYGKYRADVSPDVGFLDVVGNDRRQAWLALGDMSKGMAMTEFVKQLDSICPLLQPYVEAHKTEKEELIRKFEEQEEKRRQEEAERIQRQMEEEAEKLQALEQQRKMEQEMQIRAALNQQTLVQFRQYAEQQSPGNQNQQETLITQLQEQHYQQYMQQVYQQQLLHQQQQQKQIQSIAQTPETAADSDTTDTKPVPSPDSKQNGPTAPPGGDAEAFNPDISEEPESNDETTLRPRVPDIVPASIWTRKDIKEFKQSLYKSTENMIKIGSLATATVRVPTHEDGSCLFWEFASDYYDIGFGVFFEWTIAPSNTVSVHVSESSDEEEIEEEEQAGDAENKGDVERGKKKDDRPPTDEIIPVYRRDCHEEVYCGSHTYPGRGVYLLKFDNSYSLWRSKSLYYRVYYTR